MFSIADKLEPPGIAVTVTGHLNSATAPELEQKLDALLKSEHAYLVIDLGEVPFVASAGLRVLLACAKKAKRANRGLALLGLQPQVLQVFELAGMTRLFLIYPTADDAHASLRKRSSAA